MIYATPIENADNDIIVLKKLSRETRDTRMRSRYDVIRLSLQGRKVKEIADILNIDYQTVRNYILAYNKSGLDGLIIKKPPGKTRKLTEQQEAQLYDCIVNKMPKDVGFAPFANWTASLACKWVEREFGVVFSGRGMRNVFERLNLSYTRPTYVLKKADLLEQEAFVQYFEELKKN